MASQSILKQIANASATAGGNIIKDGKYLFTIAQMMIEKKFNGEFFIVEMIVESASEVEPGVVPNAVGTKCSYVVNLDKNVSAAGNTKAFVLALLNKSESEVEPGDFIATIEALTGAAQPARGMKLGDETYRKTIRGGPNAGKPFTAHRWQYVEQTPVQIAETRARLDTTAKAS